MNAINNELIRSFKPCYDPSEKNIPENETLTVSEWVKKYRKTVPAKDIIWLLCRPEFMSNKDLRLFAVWCAREALKLVEHPDARSIEACNVAERFANGEATVEELYAAWAAAKAAWAAAKAAWDDSCAKAAKAASSAAMAAMDAKAAWADAWYAASDAVWAAGDDVSAAWCASRDAQLNKLLNYFK